MNDVEIINKIFDIKEWIYDYNCVFIPEIELELSLNSEKINPKFITYVKLLTGGYTVNNIPDYEIVLSLLRNENENAFSELKRYLDNCNVILTRTQWLIRIPDGSTLTEKQLRDKLKFRKYVDDWFSNEVCIISEKIIKNNLW